jgi:peptide/nickel transport system permease protein
VRTRVVHRPQPVPLLPPSFLAAALLKNFVAIGFNDFLQDPVIPIVVAVIVGIVVA